MTGDMDHQNEQQREAEGSNIPNYQPCRASQNPRHDSNSRSRRISEVSQAPTGRSSNYTPQTSSRRPSEPHPQLLHRRSTAQQENPSGFSSFEHESDSIFRSEGWEILNGHEGEEEGVSNAHLAPSHPKQNPHIVMNKPVSPNTPRPPPTILRLPRNMARRPPRNHIRPIPRRRRHSLICIRAHKLRHPQSRL